MTTCERKRVQVYVKLQKTADSLEYIIPDAACLATPWTFGRLSNMAHMEPLDGLLVDGGLDVYDMDINKVERASFAIAEGKITYFGKGDIMLGYWLGTTAGCMPDYMDVIVH